jgi:hypothetical protein
VPAPEPGVRPSCRALRYGSGHREPFLWREGHDPFPPKETASVLGQRLDELLWGGIVRFRAAMSRAAAWGGRTV